MIDTHAHLNFRDFDKDLDEVIKKSFSEGVEKIVVASSSVESSKKALEIAGKDKRIFASVGIHPGDAKVRNLGKGSGFLEIEKLAGHKKVAAIGETGLDYHRLLSQDSEISHTSDLHKEGRDSSTRRFAKSVGMTEESVKQKELFEKHLDLAEKLNLPLILHNRDSDDDFYDIVKSFKGKAVLHCYSGTWDFAEKILELGFLISFTGIITFDKTGNLKKVISRIPLEKIMVETDAPYLAPVPYRGKRAEPWMVGEVIKKIADIKGLSFEEVDKQTTTTAKSFFRIS